jgi:sensor histidine kinase YesM
MSNKENQDKSSGIGMENSRRRLDLIYKDQYSLDLKEQAESYYVKLTIPL